MSYVLKLQEDEGPETPKEEKGSSISIVVCHKSHASVAFCFVK